jgi:starch synthase (maltosyl-transferring)
MLIYNLFPLLAGEFPKWNAHITRAAKMGFDWLFINPIQKSGISKSLYSISDYYEIDDRFIDYSTATEVPPEVQLRNVINYAHDCGMKVMIDLVINHCAIDSELTRSQYHWFKRHNGSIVNPSCVENGHTVSWKDLAQFDHNNEHLYEYIQGMCAWLLWHGFDGFRCDAAYMVPQNFWKRLISDIKSKYPNTKFIAETLGCKTEETISTAQAGFDAVFNSSKWWDYKSNWLLETHDRTRNICPSISFPESHDTERLLQETNGNVNAVKLRYAFTSLFSSGVMMPYGFEWGFRKRLHVVNTKPSDCYWTGIDLSSYITAVNSLKKTYRIFQRDTSVIKLNDNFGQDILPLMKTCPESNEEVLLIMNTNINSNRYVYINDCRRFFSNGSKLQVAFYNEKTSSLEINSSHNLSPYNNELKPGQFIAIIATK